MALNERTTRQSLGGRIDSRLDKLYNYHGERAVPQGVTSNVWAAPASLPEGVPDTTHYFLHYFQSQGRAGTNNECVTTSTLMAMNMMEDRIAATRPDAPLLYQANLQLEDFIHDLDRMGILGWRYRFSTHSPLPGMMPPWGARAILRKHANALQKRYGAYYRVQTLSHLTVDDLVQTLEQSAVVLLHGAWQKRLSDPADKFLALLGGMPHTMVLVGYEPAADAWNLLNPADPWVKSRTDPCIPKLYVMTSEQLIDFWGRRFLFYPPRFSITTLTLEN